jgi:hypothetical protein
MKIRLTACLFVTLFACDFALSEQSGQNPRTLFLQQLRPAAAIATAGFCARPDAEQGTWTALTQRLSAAGASASESDVTLGTPGDAPRHRMMARACGWASEKK